MGMENRDWYREGARRRQADTDRSAQGGWRERQGTPRPQITLNLRPMKRRWSLQPIAVVLTIGLLGVAATRPSLTFFSRWLGNRSAPVMGAVHSMLSGEPTDNPSVPFPVNGYTVTNLPPEGRRDVPLTIETTGVDSGRRWVINVRDWARDTWVTTIYLEAASVTTVFLPAGSYRLSAAAGDRWSGDARLFGRETVAWQARAPVTLASYGDHSVGHVIYITATTNPNMPWDSMPTEDFRTKD